MTTIVLLARKIFVMNNETKKKEWMITYNIDCNTWHTCYIFFYIDETLRLLQHNKLEN